MGLITCSMDGVNAQMCLGDGSATAMSLDWFRKFDAVLNDIQAVARAVVFRAITGFFSTPTLLPHLSAEGRAQLSDVFAGPILKLFLYPIPTIAVVEGHAIVEGQYSRWLAISD